MNSIYSIEPSISQGLNRREGPEIGWPGVVHDVHGQGQPERLVGPYNGSPAPEANG